MRPPILGRLSHICPGQNCVRTQLQGVLKATFEKGNFGRETCMHMLLLTRCLDVQGYELAGAARCN